MPSKIEKWKGVISSLFKKKGGEFDDDDGEKEETKSLIGPPALANASIGRPPNYTEKPTASPLYVKALKSYLGGDNQSAANVALEAIRKNPKDKDAIGLLSGLERKGNYGYKIEKRVVRTGR